MEIFLASIIAFATTNIDDIFILALFFGSKKFRERDIIAGQYLGIISLIGISFVGSLLELVIAPHYIGLLGFVPIYLGIKGVINLNKPATNEETEFNIGGMNNQLHSNVFSVASITISNGGDNISIYIPLFATLVLQEKLIMISIFLLMTGVWCLLAKCVAKYPVVKNALEKYGDVVTPIVFIFLGIYILYESRAYRLVTQIWE